MKKQSIIKFVALGLLFIHQGAVTIFNFDPLPFEENQVYEFASWAVTAVMAAYTSWFDNPVTDESIVGTKKTKQLKQQKKVNNQ